MSKLTQRLASAFSAVQARPPPTFIAFGEYQPDLSDTNNQGTSLAQNVMPAANGYRPFPSLSTITDALTARCRGAYAAQDTAGNVYTYAGDGTKLYSLSSTTWADASGFTYDLGDDVTWWFAQYGQRLIAGYYSPAAIETQSITVGAATFGNLFVSTRKPRAASGCIFRDFLVMLRTTDSVDGAKPQRIWWSALGDVTDATPNATTQSDFQDMDSNDGWGQRIVANKEFITVFFERAVYRMTYVGGDVIFQIDKMSYNVGTQAPNSVVSAGRLAFFLDISGPFVFDGTNVSPIGEGKVSQTIIDNLDTSYLDRICGAFDPINRLYMLSTPLSGGSGTPTKIYLYYIPKQQWSYVNVTTEWIFTDLTKGITLDGLDALFASIDVVTPNLDSRVWTGGNILTGAFNSSHILGHFDGTVMDATLDTYEYANGRRQDIMAFWPMIDLDGELTTITVQVATRDTLSASVSYGAAISMDSIGKADVNVDARYCRFRVNISGDWDHALGGNADILPGGMY